MHKMIGSYFVVLMPSLTGLAAGFNAPISGVFFAVETVLSRQPDRVPGEDAGEASGLTVAMVLLASVLAAVVSQVSILLPSELCTHKMMQYHYYCHGSYYGKSDSRV